ncbi:MAG: hypothetical protein DRI37_08300 [Chloroflexi bacterium]|nr:MAG: hypothetical protein DRI37_08300 [Chloroflexota bacterium]
MTTWELDVRRGWYVGLGLVALLVLLAAGLATLAVLNPISILTFFLGLGVLGALAGAGVLIYWLWSLVHAFYTLDRNALVIHWGEYESQLSLAAVRSVFPGSELEGARLRGVVRWPGYCVGWGNAPATGPLRFYAAAPLAQQIILCTEDMAYAISPADSEGFLAALQERRQMGITQEIAAQTQHPAFMDWEIWRDRLALVLLGSSGLLSMLLAGLLCWRYPSLPPEIALRTSHTGEVLLLANSSRIFYLAFLSALFTVLNGGGGLFFYHRERLVSYLLWAGLWVLQVSLWIAVLMRLLER